MKSRAILVFADSLGIDLARRRLPASARPLLAGPGAERLRSQAEVHVFSSATLASSDRYTSHLQSGRSFGEKLQNAVERLTTLGFEEIVIVGRDCPRLGRGDIALAFEGLATQRLVLGPDHRGGCYLIALRAEDRELLRGICWRQNTDCAELQSRCNAGDVLLLCVKEDVDSWADVRFLARAHDRVGRIAARLLLAGSVFTETLDHFVDLAASAVRIRGQMPPPASLS